MAAEKPKTVRRNSHIFDEELQIEALANIAKTDLTTDDVTPSVLKRKMDVELQEYRQMNIDHEEGIFCMKWSNDGQYLAVGCSDGNIRIMTRSGRLAFRLRTVGTMPITTLRWRPTPNGGEPVLITATANGVLQHWHVPSQKCIHTLTETDNQIFALECRPDGTIFASGGKDKIVRLYDSETKEVVGRMEKGYLAQHPGHSNRIFALKFKPDDPNVILSGSWDDTVLFWDIRSGQAFRSVFGPHIAGQTLDIQNNVVLTGSWRSEDAIQTWDFSNGKNITSLDWRPSPMVYCAQFSTERDGIIAAGGTGVNEVRLCDVHNKIKSPPVYLPGKEGVYTLDFDPLGNLLAFGGSSSVIQILSLKTVASAAHNNTD